MAFRTRILIIDSSPISTKYPFSLLSKTPSSLRGCGARGIFELRYRHDKFAGLEKHVYNGLRWGWKCLRSSEEVKNGQ